MALEMAFPIVLILTLFISAFVVLTRHQAHMRAQRNLPDRADYFARVGATGASAESVVARVHGHAEQPGLDPQGATVTREVAVRGEEDLLGDVLGLLGVVEKASREAVDAGVQGRVELLEGAPIAAPQRDGQRLLLGRTEVECGHLPPRWTVKKVPSPV